MREILFRGKRIFDGKWVNGFAYKQYSAAKVEEWYIRAFETDFLVIPETVCQFTGLTDKNGKRIFEGDILHIAKIADGLGGYYQPPLDYPVNVVVKWDLCAWMWETLCDDKRYITFPDAWRLYECEIIGNVHDNPELLREEAQP